MAFDRAWGVFLYNRTMQRLLHLFKYGHKTSLRHFFTEQICSFARDYHLNLNAHDLIVAVPLYPTRQRQRGYNQSLLIAQMLSEELKVPLENKSLLRIRHTPNQARLSQKERWTNMDAAFKINPDFALDSLLRVQAKSAQRAACLDKVETCGVNPCGKPQPKANFAFNFYATIRRAISYNAKFEFKPSNNLRHKNILLVDDLLTTGATASQAAQVLKDAGANKVNVLTTAIATLATTNKGPQF